MQKAWEIQTTDTEAVARISHQLKYHPAMATILVQRGLNSEKDIQAFLQPSLHHLRSPFSLAGMTEAVARLSHALLNMEKILIFGDYDVDGVTATTLLYQFLKEIGADVSYHIPHRVTEGYSLKTTHITNIAIPGKIKVLLTVDCGVSSHEAVSLAQSSQIDVIITDHHDIPENLPDALAVINPKRDDCQSGLGNLSGVGIAFYLAMALRKHLRDNGFFNNREEPNLKKSCDLVALGTVSDMVPLVHENRILTCTGLEILRSAHRPGVKALADACGVDHRHMDAQDISFRLGPRINAAGRMDHAGIAARLLRTHHPQKAGQDAELLGKLNSQRQQEEESVLADILARLDRDPSLAQRNCMVFASPDWHEGVVGIVAARLTRLYFKPAILISVKKGMGKGSARSIPGIDIRSALTACAHMLHGFGGHPMAAGLQIPADQIEPFWDRLSQVISQVASPQAFTPKVTIDYTLELSDITAKLLDEVTSLGPFGVQNSEPVFMANNVHVHTSKIVGKGHRRMRLSASAEKKNKGLWAIQFNADPASIRVDQFTKIAYCLQWNRWNGNKSIQLLVSDTRYR
jgi:single-stranded-DNA-specific exonuclease